MDWEWTIKLVIYAAGFGIGVLISEWRKEKKARKECIERKLVPLSEVDKL